MAIPAKAQKGDAISIDALLLVPLAPAVVVAEGRPVVEPFEVVDAEAPLKVEVTTAEVDGIPAGASPS